MAVSLKFINEDAAERVCEIMLADRVGIAPIMDWYGAFHAGDNYRVEVNGKRVPMDQNGGMIGQTIEARAEAPRLKLVQD